MSNLIVRDFRGSRLFLASVHSGNGMRWVSDSQQASRYDTDEALAICEKASRAWGVQCAILDTTGTLAQPKPLTTPQLKKKALRGVALRGAHSRFGNGSKQS